MARRSKRRKSYNRHLTVSIKSPLRQLDVLNDVFHKLRGPRLKKKIIPDEIRAEPLRIRVERNYHARKFTNKNRLPSTNKKVPSMYETIRKKEFHDQRLLHIRKVCKGRSERRRSLFRFRLIGKGRGGSHKKKIFTKDSKVRC